ncbi:hypothetical protein [Chryseobacterium sp. MDT2-18]|uniref:hypothetical protein n=1 Tax=Chryseobacterium sp. MDT2-18 TaxID=1259136 RepID=UPI00278722E8|nr:hypothetical protein [Chryseobacterium sp. MDT2-18]MDQ0478275.1 hypothetical protein [Chryseobacterium sp. MDT2-18]
MTKLYIGEIFLFGILHLSAQENKTLWQKDIKSDTQDFISTPKAINKINTMPAQFGNKELNLQ